MPTLLHNGSILVDGVFRDDLAVVVDGDRIAAVATTSVLRVAFPDAQPRDLNGDRLVPGYIDTQVNGGGGVLFNDAPTAETIARIGAAHRRFGQHAARRQVAHAHDERRGLAGPQKVGLHEQAVAIGAARQRRHFLIDR